MGEVQLKERRVRPVLAPPRPPRPDLPVPMFRKFPYWRRAKRLYLEHWVMGTIGALALANAVRLLAF